MTNLLLLLLLLFPLSFGNSYWFYERNGVAFCPNKSELCYCNITYNNPYTPKIPAYFLNTAILSPHYYYIYLIFDFPKNQKYRRFYLEATDISRNETVISNGDCYLIDVKNIYEYELRIYKTLYSNSVISIKFLGFNPEFFMMVKLKFARDLSIYYNGVMLTNLNSLNKSNVPELMEYDAEMQQKIVKQNQRKSQAIAQTNKILLNLFGKTLHSDIEFKETTFTQIIPTPFFLVTVTIAVGLEESTENFFKSNEDEQTLTDFISIHGDISLESSMFDNIFGDNISVDNNLLNLIKILNKKINDVLLTLSLETEIFSLSIARSLTKNCIIFTFRFFDQVTHKNFYEIEIKVELKDNWIVHTVLAANSILSEALNKAAEFERKHGKNIEILIYSMIIAAIILSIIILAIGGIIAAVGGAIAGLGASVSLFIHSLSFEIPIGPVVEFIKMPH